MVKKVWYVAYGSNLLLERFMCYIRGGRFREYSKEYKGCTNRTPPECNKQYMLPYELYYGNKSSTWCGRGVAFIDADKKGECSGRAYLITDEQFYEIQKQEGSSANWYGRIVELGKDENDIPYRTFTSKIRNEDNEPSIEYKQIIEEGLEETRGQNNADG
jgi:hypothetical protein